MQEGNEDPENSKLVDDWGLLGQSTQVADDVEQIAILDRDNILPQDEATNRIEIEIQSCETVQPFDFLFLCGLAEPIHMSPSDFPVDLASFVAILATEPHPSSAFAITSLVIQLAVNLVVWIKILLLSSVLIDSMTPRCTSNSQCKPGLFCFPLALAYDTDWPTETRGNSICNDCSFSNLFNGTDIPQAEEFLMAGRDYCATDDPERCDFLQANRGKYSYFSLLVLCCLCGMLGRMIYLDLHKVHVQQRLYDHRLQLMKMATTQQTGKAKLMGSIRVHCAATINWFTYASRAFILPSWMCTGAALLLTTWAPTTRNLILVPIQIGLIANFDMVTEFVFLRQSHKDFTRIAARALDSQHWRQQSSFVKRYDKMLAVLIRLYSFGLSVQIPIFVLMAESIYPTISFLTRFAGQNPFPIPIPCNDVIAAGIYFPFFVSLPMTLLIGPVTNRCRCTAIHLLSYVSTFLFVLYSSFLVREIITYLQFQSF